MVRGYDITVLVCRSEKDLCSQVLTVRYLYDGWMDGALMVLYSTHDINSSFLRGSLEAGEPCRWGASGATTIASFYLSFPHLSIIANGQGEIRIC